MCAAAVAAYDEASKVLAAKLKQREFRHALVQLDICQRTHVYDLQRSSRTPSLQLLRRIAQAKAEIEKEIERRLAKELL